jgi:hypothetical protein
MQHYNPARLEYRIELAKYKPDQGVLGQSHDLAAIELVAGKRKGHVRRIEEAKAFFLTSDMRLAKYNLIENGHQHRGSIGEAIHERILTNILWLKSPTMLGELPLRSIIAIYSNHQFIDQKVWTAFTRTLEKLRREGIVDDNDISIFLYDRQVQEVLTDYDLEGENNPDATWLLENIEEVRRRAEAEQEGLVRQRAEAEHQVIQVKAAKEEAVRIAKEEVKEIFAAELDEIKRTSQENAHQIMATIRAKIEAQAKRESTVLSTAIIVIAVGLLTFASMRFMPAVTSKWATLEPVAWVLSIMLPICLSLLGIHFDLLSFRSKLRDFLFKLALQRKLQDLQTQTPEAGLRLPIPE